MKFFFLFCNEFFVKKEKEKKGFNIVIKLIVFYLRL